MKKNKGLYITVIVLEALLIVALGVFLYVKWYKPYKEEKDLKGSISNISFEDVNSIRYFNTSKSINSIKTA